MLIKNIPLEQLLDLALLAVETAATATKSAYADYFSPRRRALQ
jgi:hypothetical protein